MVSDFYYRGFLYPLRLLGIIRLLESKLVTHDNLYAARPGPQWRNVDVQVRLSAQSHVAD